MLPINIEFLPSYQISINSSIYLLYQSIWKQVNGKNTRKSIVIISISLVVEERYYFIRYLF